MTIIFFCYYTATFTVFMLHFSMLGVGFNHIDEQPIYAKKKTVTVCKNCEGLILSILI